MASPMKLLAAGAGLAGISFGGYNFVKSVEAAEISRARPVEALSAAQHTVGDLPKIGYLVLFPNNGPSRTPEEEPLENAGAALALLGASALGEVVIFKK